METAIINFINIVEDTNTEMEIPLNITANDLIYALDEVFLLGIDREDVLECYLVAENPIAFLKGNKELSEYGIRNGTDIIFTRR